MKSVSAVLLSLIVCLAPPYAVGAEADPGPSTELQQEARRLLMDMSGFLAGLDRFSVNVVAGYDVLQSSGQKIEFLEAREILLDRPGRLRVRERNAEGLGSQVIFDGSKMTLWEPVEGVFAQVDQPGSVDDAILYFVRDLGMRLPLAQLLTVRFPAELERKLQSIEYVEVTEVLGEKAHHIAGRTRDVDFQVWVADGERPLPLRIVLTYADEGRPQYWAQFADWNLQPQVGDGTFAFEPPPDARRIPLEIQIQDLTERAP